MADDPLKPHLYHFDFDPEIHADLMNRLLKSPELALVKGVGPNLKGVAEKRFLERMALP